jgi:alpha-ribazole phosphatase
MRRALQSAELLFPGAAERIVLEDLRECRFGEFEGRRVEELAEDGHFTLWLDPASGYVPQGGESGLQFGRRCARALAAMLEHQMRRDISEAACVAHGGVIMSMLSQMAVPRRKPVGWMADNGAGFTVRSSAAMLTRDNLVEAVDIVPVGYLDERGQ